MSVDPLPVLRRELRRRPHAEIAVWLIIFGFADNMLHCKDRGLHRGKTSFAFFCTRVYQGVISQLSAAEVVGFRSVIQRPSQGC